MIPIDIKDLKDKIISDTNNIKLILEYIGCDRISESTKEFRCAKNIEDYNSTRVVVKKNEYLKSIIYDLHTIDGDIFVLIMELKKCKLSEAMKVCCDAIGIKFDGKINIRTKQKKTVFGGFFEEVKKQKLKNTIQLNTHSDDELLQFVNKGSYLFYNDGVEYDIQSKFEIMYDDNSNRIVVPWRDVYGKIVGIMGRYNDSSEYCKDNNISKWLPINGYNFPKSQVVYGLYQNYRYILQAGRVYVGESEKFVLQTASFGARNTVAIGSHEILDMHKRLLLSLGVEIVLAFDNDIPDEVNIEQCKKFESKSSLLKTRVGFVMTDDILREKESPSDRGIEVWNLCVSEDNIFWL